MSEVFKRILAFSIVYLPMLIALIVGGIIYKKRGKEIRQEVERQHRQKQEQGGIGSLYYKRTHRRVFKRSFGIPILIAFAVTLLGLLIVLKVFG